MNRLAFHPTLSKKVANLDWAVVLPPQGPPVSTNLKTRLVGGRPCGRRKIPKCHVSRPRSMDAFCSPEEASPGQRGCLKAGWSVPSFSWCSAHRGPLVIVLFSPHKYRIKNRYFSPLLLLQCTSYHSAGLSLMSPVPSAYLQRSLTTAIFRPAATRGSSSLKAALESISQDLNVALFCPLPLRFRRNCFGNLGCRKCCRIRVWFLRVASEPRLALFMSPV